MRVASNVADAASQPGIIVAAGTALQLVWGDRAPVGDLVDITALAEGRGIRLEAGTLRIGALETLETCRISELVQHHAGLLAEACGVIGALGVRNLGTLGGNIGWRQGDTIPALLVLAARVECEAGVMMLADALALPKLPLLLGVRIPPLVHPCLTVFEKVGHRAAFSPSVATVAGWCRLDADGRVAEARLAIGGDGRPARLLNATAALLVGADPHDDMVWNRIAADVAMAWDDEVAGRVLSGRLRAAVT
jgi:carbon-monoxide dehydrogenase medium subunit